MVNYETLLKKLDSVGLREPINNILKSYQKNSKQRVIIAEKYSPDCVIEVGVPQGSAVLGPIQFMCCINYLLKLSKTDI